MGDIITTGDSLIITVFSMVIVFLTLLIISYLIDGLRLVTNKNNATKENGKVKIEDQDLLPEEKLVSEKSIKEDEELVAVIAAAIAASEGISIPQVKINTIKRVSKNTPTWAKTGREENIFNKL
ncbi:MAG TPA: OadG family protein [Tissierellales bacterium]|nr:OadG family protein [Tissierellales bacterium]